MKKVIFALLILGLFATACTQQEAEPSQTPAAEETTSDSGETPESDSSSETTQAVKEFTIVGTEFGFSPSGLMVTEGETVKITFKNEGSYEHNIVFDDLDFATKTISSGETDVLEFTAPAAGTYTFYCSVGSHADAGMKGTLTVR